MTFPGGSCLQRGALSSDGSHLQRGALSALWLLATVGFLGCGSFLGVSELAGDAGDPVGKPVDPTRLGASIDAGANVLGPREDASPSGIKDTGTWCAPDGFADHNVGVGGLTYPACEPKGETWPGMAVVACSTWLVASEHGGTSDIADPSATGCGDPVVLCSEIVPGHEHTDGLTRPLYVWAFAGPAKGHLRWVGDGGGLCPTLSDPVWD